MTSAKFFYLILVGAALISNAGVAAIRCPQYVTCGNGHCVPSDNALPWRITQIKPANASGVILFWEAHGFVRDNPEKTSAPALCIYTRHKGGAYAQVQLSGGNHLQADNKAPLSKWQPANGSWWKCVMNISSSDPDRCVFVKANGF